MTMPYPLPAHKRLCLIGAGDPIKELALHLAGFKDHFESILLISNRELDQQWSVETPPIEELAKRLNMALLLVDPFDTDALTAHVRDHGCNMGMLLQWRAILPKPFLDHFQGILFNYHPTPLPRYRGAASATWQIMQGERETAITIHQVTASVDAGAILFTETVALDRAPEQPDDMQRAARQLFSQSAAKRLAMILSTRDHVVLTPQDAHQATYYPMLFTPKNGLIDFSWKPSQIQSFVRSFSDPYPGASFQYREQRYFSKACEPGDTDERIHPFTHGLITHIQDDWVVLFADSGTVKLGCFHQENGVAVAPTFFRVGERFYNSPADLFAARLYRHRISS